MPISEVGAEEQLRGPVAGDEPVLYPMHLPDDARLAVSFQIAIEAWAAANTSGSVYGSRSGMEAGSQGTPDWATVSAQAYGVRTGFWRLLRIVDEQDIPTTFTMSGLVAERWPTVARAASDRGHEIVGHGYSQDRAMYKMDEEEDLDTVTRTTETIESVTGQRPIGWASHGSRRGSFTVQSLIKNDYVYTNDFRDADVPYVVAELSGRKLLSMPRSDQVNDLVLIQNNGNTPESLVDLFKRAFDQAYREGTTAPTVVNCVVHATVSGRGWGASAFEECIKYAKSYPEAWICHRRDIAKNYWERQKVS